MANRQETLAAVLSISPILLSVPGREKALEIRVSAPVSGQDLPILVFAHGFGSSMDGYAPLVNYWAAQGFVVIQPTFLDSRTLAEHHHADHGDAVRAYLADPRSALIWRQRVDDVKSVLDQLDFIETSLPTLKGRMDKNRIVASGHSFGAHTIGLLLGARVVDQNGQLEQDMSDDRIMGAVLLSAGGRGGDALSAFAKAHFPYMEQDFTGLRTPTLVVAGDQDRSPLTVLGPEWFTDVFTLSPGADSLLTVFGGEHMLGGISGYLVRETTDENPARVALVQKMSTAYLRHLFYPEDKAWSDSKNELKTIPNSIGKLDEK